MEKPKTKTEQGVFRLDSVLRSLLEEAMQARRAKNMSEYIRGLIIRDYRMIFKHLPAGKLLEIPAWVTAEETATRQPNRDAEEELQREKEILERDSAQKTLHTKSA